MEKIEWCMKQKNGIEIIEPNENLSKAYLKKAEDALNAAASLKGNKDWEISSLYYTMYFSLYSILMRVGIKCEIHSCTIEFMKQFLQGYFNEDDFFLIKKSMKARIDTQYYSDRDISKSQYSNMISQAPLFLVKCKEILFGLTNKNVEDIRNKIV